MTLEDAIAVFRAHGLTLTVTHAPLRHVAAGTAATLLDFKPKYIKAHIRDFPHAWRAPGGEIRIPLSDIEHLAQTRRINRPTKD